MDKFFNDVTMPEVLAPQKKSSEGKDLQKRVEDCEKILSFFVDLVQAMHITYVNAHEGTVNMLQRAPQQVAQSVADEPNYFAPMKNIAVLLSQDWFDEVSANQKKFTKTWREILMSTLLDSEYKDDIAREWTDAKKRIQIKCHVVGALIDAKVIKGSYRAIASKMNLNEKKPASLARYMSNAKNQPYYDYLLALAKK